jgi:hypothetical protein
MSWIPEDIDKRLRSDFGVDAELAREELDGLLGIASDAALTRIARCVVHLANRELDKLSHFVESARQDWRDVIWWAEYDGKEERLRDFNRRFE